VHFNSSSQFLNLSQNLLPTLEELASFNKDFKIKIGKSRGSLGKKNYENTPTDGIDMNLCCICFENQI